MAETISQVRKIIKAKELIEYAQKNVLNPDPDEPDISAAKVGLIKLLLNKVIPDLKGVEISGDFRADVTHQLIQLEVIGSDQSKTS